MRERRILGLASRAWLLGVCLLAAGCGPVSRGSPSSPPVTPTAQNVPGIAQVTLASLPEGSCGPLTADEPAYTPLLVTATSRAQFKYARRIDMSLRSEESEWCIAGLRVYDIGAELVGRLSGPPPGNRAVWEAAGRDLTISELEVRTETGRLLGGAQILPRREDIRSLNLYAPVTFSGPPALRASDLPDAEEWRRAVREAKGITLRAKPIRMVDGPWGFPPLPIAEGPLNISASANGVSLRLFDFRVGPSVAFQRMSEIGFDRYIQKLEWDSARDDLGTVYRPTLISRQNAPGGGMQPWFYQNFEPRPPAGARTIQFSIQRAYVLGGGEWSVTLPVR